MITTTPAQYAARLFPGLSFIDAGLGKFKADKQTADHLHGVASVGMPLAKKVDSKTFTNAISVAGSATGAALLTPLVPNRVQARSSPRSVQDSSACISVRRACAKSARCPQPTRVWHWRRILGSWA